MDKVNKVNEIGQMIVNLYWRWLDEKKYEDINEYGKVLSDKLGFAVVMTKKPFGFKFDNYQVSVSGGNKAKLQIFKLG